MGFMITAAKLKPILLFSVCLLFIPCIQAVYNWDECVGNPRRALGITRVTMKPDPVISGTKVKFVIETKAVRTVDPNIPADDDKHVETVLQYSGNHQLVDVKPIGKALIERRKNFEYCKRADGDCPIISGQQFTIDFDIDLPKLAMVGDMSLQVRVMARSKNMFACLKVDFRVQPNTQVLEEDPESSDSQSTTENSNNELGTKTPDFEQGTGNSNTGTETDNSNKSGTGNKIPDPEQGSDNPEPGTKFPGNGFPNNTESGAQTPFPPPIIDDFPSLIN